MLFSIITICKNIEKSFETTADSIINQNFKDFEWIVIDGGSNQISLNSIEKYKKNFAHYESENDKGIYDAMNKGLARASGDYILFMNGGDAFFDNNVLGIIHSNIFIDAGIDVFYGNVCVAYTSFFKFKKARNFYHFSTSLPTSHQSFIINKKAIATSFFDISYKYCADFNMIYNLFHLNHKFKKINVTIATVVAGGVSDVNRIAAIEECRTIVMQRNCTIGTKILFTFAISKANLILYFKRVFNKSFVEFVTKYK